ncbi:MAG: exonuclease domain-containing protein [Ruminococcaceae bacterium]|nr:exonuclease domain-containing protein [Oscillospiraceae bacterium]
MYYITLDLEWNQAYAEKALAVQKRLSRRLRGEVIQIGAVKLDKNMNPCGSYQTIVKPKYFKKLHRHVSVLTGITQEQIDLGISLPEAAERFRKWCGRDFVFLTWGPDDIPMLKENFRVHDISVTWLDKTYDLQLIFNRQTDGGTKQRSLEYAMEYFEIPQNLPAHDALNDAYFTALVAEKLDVKEGIKSYNLRRGALLLDTVIGDADAGEDGYVTIKELLDDDAVKNPVCPICSTPLTQELNMLHSKGQRYTYLCNCKKDGKMLFSMKLHRNFNDTWRARCTFELANAEKIEEFKKGLERSNIKRKAKRRKTRRKAPAVSPPSSRTE